MKQAEEHTTDYSKYIDLISKEEFIARYPGDQKAENWFSREEQGRFSGPGGLGSLAARFLIKKRVCEELQTAGMEKEIEILNDSYGKPEVVLSGALSEALSKSGFSRIVCSISHSRNYIIAMTIFCK